MVDFTVYLKVDVNVGAVRRAFFYLVSRIHIPIVHSVQSAFGLLRRSFASRVRDPLKSDSSARHSHPDTSSKKTSWEWFSVVQLSWLFRFSAEPEDGQTPSQTPENAVFEPCRGKKRKPGTGCISKVSKNTWQGKYTPVNPDGTRQRYCVYARTREECERKLDEMIKQKTEKIEKNY